MRGRKPVLSSWLFLPEMWNDEVGLIKGKKKVYTANIKTQHSQLKH
jgi:hypothetical protein